MIDLTDYVDVGAAAWFAEKAPEGVVWADVEDQVFKNDVRTMILPIVSAVLEAYNSQNKPNDYDFLGGIG